MCHQKDSGASRRRPTSQSAVVGQTKFVVIQELGVPAQGFIVISRRQICPGLVKVAPDASPAFHEIRIGHDASVGVIRELNHPPGSERGHLVHKSRRTGCSTIVGLRFARGQEPEITLR